MAQCNHGESGSKTGVSAGQKWQWLNINTGMATENYSAGWQWLASIWRTMAAAQLSMSGLAKLAAFYLQSGENESYHLLAFGFS